VYIASLNNEYSGNNIIDELFDSSDGFDRGFTQETNLPNMTPQSILSLGRLIEICAKKNDPGFSLEELVQELYYFLTGDDIEYMTDIMDYFKKGKDPYFVLDDDVAARFGLPSENNEALWNYLSYDTVVFSTLSDTDTFSYIQCTGIKNHIIESPYLAPAYTTHFNDDYTSYILDFNSSELDLNRMAAIKVLIERDENFTGSSYTTKLFISGKDAMDLNDLDYTGEFIQFLDLNNAGFDVSSGNKILYELEKDNGNFSDHIYRMLEDKDVDYFTNEKIEKESYAFFFFLIPHEDNVPVDNIVLEDTYTGSISFDGDILLYDIDVPEDVTIAKLEITLKCLIADDNSFADYDLYVKWDSPPTFTDYYDHSNNWDSDSEAVTINHPSSGTWYVMVYKFDGDGIPLSDFCGYYPAILNCGQLL
jgi:hypothetical protein